MKAVLNSTWRDGKLNYRIALLGDRPAITLFLSQHESFSVNFQSQNSASVFSFPVDPAAFQWAPEGFNGGIPTMQTTGSIELDLPVYEQSVQWNLNWQN